MHLNICKHDDFVFSLVEHKKALGINMKIFDHYIILQNKLYLLHVRNSHI